ncbi:MAG: hypothetical protein EOO78_15610, partial [Oxalobacteraceae bacterium]
AANPIGLSQLVQGTPFGRFDLGTGINFNRDFLHVAVDASCGIQPFEFAPQDVGHQHRRHLVRVQRGLDVRLFAAAGAVARAAVMAGRQPVGGDAWFVCNRMGLYRHACSLRTPVDGFVRSIMYEFLHKVNR